MHCMLSSAALHFLVPTSNITPTLPSRRRVGSLYRLWNTAPRSRQRHELCQPSVSVAKALQYHYASSTSPGLQVPRGNTVPVLDPASACAASSECSEQCDRTRVQHASALTAYQSCRSLSPDIGSVALRHQHGCLLRSTRLFKMPQSYVLGSIENLSV